MYFRVFRIKHPEQHLVRKIHGWFSLGIRIITVTLTNLLQFPGHLKRFLGNIKLGWKLGKFGICHNLIPIIMSPGRFRGKKKRVQFPNRYLKSFKGYVTYI